MNARNHKTLDPGKELRLWLLWVIGNTAGWMIGMGGALGIGMLLTDSLTEGSLSPGKYSYSGLVGVAAAFLLAILLSAIFVSLVQWLILRKEISKGWTWLMATFIGVLIGLGIAVVIGGTIPGWIAFGAIVGAMQWLVLRTKVNRAVNWILINILSGAVGGSAGWIFTRYFESRAVVSTIGVMFSSILTPPIVASLITGFGLVWNLQQGPPIPSVVRSTKRPDPEPSVIVPSEQATDWLEELLNKEK